MTDYYVVLSVICTFAILNVASGDNKVISLVMLTFVFILMSFFIGYRWEIGSDWQVYFENYNYFHYDGFEGGYVILERFFYKLGAGYSLFLLFITSFSLLIIFYSIFKSVDYALVAILFFAANYMLSFMGGNRQIIAIAIVFFSNHFIYKRCLTRFIFTILLATCFHVSSCIYIFAYFLYRPASSFLIRYVFLSLAIVFGGLIAPSLLNSAFKVFDAIGFHYIASKLASYQNVIFDDYSVTSLAKKIIMLLIFEYCLVRARAEGDNTLNNKIGFFYNIYLFSLIFDSLVGPINAAYMRASVYFRISEIVLISYMISTTKNITYKYMILFVIFCLSFRQLYSGLEFYPDLYSEYENVIYSWF